ncbi:MAG: hypothetical protein R3D29_12310 [Nitratireductor sp.]
MAGNAVPSGKWQALAPVNGDGATICNTDGDAYACFALRCGKVAGLNSHSCSTVVTMATIRKRPSRLTRDTPKRCNSRLWTGRENWSRHSETNTHAGLTAALQQGNSFKFDIGFNHVFSLKGSGREIVRTLEMCQSEGFDPGEPVVVNQGTLGLDGTGGARQAKTSQAADLSWRKDDTEASYVARIRNAAVPYGGPCDEEQAVFERLQRDIKVSLDKTDIRAGDYVTVNWSGNTLTELVPAYLVVATDAPVRFKGEGFYALMPNAIGPFGIETFKDKTRAVVPLYGRGAQDKGTIPIEGILAGHVPLEFAVVGWQRKCQIESAEAVSLGEVKVKPAGLPVIDLDDRFAVEQPEKYLVNADGSRLIDERNDGTWRLLDAETLQVIFEGTGTEPRFSETGRFVSALNEEHMFVFDAVDGSLLHKDNFESVAWDNHDSFIGFSFHSWGAFRAFNSLNFSNEYSRGGGPGLKPAMICPCLTRKTTSLSRWIMEEVRGSGSVCQMCR